MSGNLKLYPQLMDSHSFGVPLYLPSLTSILRPGCVGYFDNLGKWNLIAHLADSYSLADKMLSIFDDKLHIAPVEDGITWGPMISSGVEATKVELPK
jgi:hypothetical protein